MHQHPRIDQVTKAVTTRSPHKTLKTGGGIAFGASKLWLGERENQLVQLRPVYSLTKLIQDATILNGKEVVNYTMIGRKAKPIVKFD